MLAEKKYHAGGVINPSAHADGTDLTAYCLKRLRYSVASTSLRPCAAKSAGFASSTPIQFRYNRSGSASQVSEVLHHHKCLL